MMSTFWNQSASSTSKTNFISSKNGQIKVENIHCRMASCWADCPSACTCSSLQDEEPPASSASVWPLPTCPAGCNSQPAEAKTEAQDKRFHIITQAGYRIYVECNVCWNSPHPSSHNAQLGSHFAALLWPFHPHQLCVTLPSPADGAGQIRLTTQTHCWLICLADFHDVPFFNSLCMLRQLL